MPRAFARTSLRPRGSVVRKTAYLDSLGPNQSSRSYWINSAEPSPSSLSFRRPAGTSKKVSFCTRCSADAEVNASARSLCLAKSRARALISTLCPTIRRDSLLPRVLFVFETDELQELGIRQQGYFDCGAPRPRISFGIINGDSDFHVSEIFPVETGGDVQRFGRRFA